MNKDEDSFIGDLSLLDVLEIIWKPPVLDKVFNDDFDHYPRRSLLAVLSCSLYKHSSRCQDRDLKGKQGNCLFTVMYVDIYMYTNNLCLEPIASSTWQ